MNFKTLTHQPSMWMANLGYWIQNSPSQNGTEFSKHENGNILSREVKDGVRGDWSILTMPKPTTVDWGV